ncbi:MAG: hypothetical protein Q9217_003666 [Psora testacea]
MSTATPSKRQKTDVPYELIYWPSLPGRGEPIRLCFEATSTPYTDVSNRTEAGVQAVLEQISKSNLGSGSNPPPLAPPILRHGDLLLSQLPNILLYLGPRLGLAGLEDDETAIYHVNQLALTALDGLSNEVHNVHHPIATSAYYEEQKEEAKVKAKDYLETRLPKFLEYFERVLQGEASKGGEYLYAGQLTFADLVLWHCLDGVTHAFPRAMEKVRKEGMYGRVFMLYDRIKGMKEIEEYLGSERRMKYGKGIYRHYPELDIEE